MYFVGGGVYFGGEGGGREPKKVRLGKSQKKADWQVIGENFITAVGLVMFMVELLIIFTEAVCSACMWQGAPDLLCSFA